MRFCFFLHFSIGCTIEKWRHVPVPQESLPFAEIPKLVCMRSGPSGAPPIALILAGC
jgi:hypothetical protein